MTNERAARPLPADELERLAEGGTWLLDLVAAVDFLRRGHRPGLTVWDALEEAVRTSTGPAIDDDAMWDRADPLGDSLHRLLDTTSGPVAPALQAALRRWITAMADRFNNGHHWPHPTPRRGFPPPLLQSTDDDELP